MDKEKLDVLVAPTGGVAGKTDLVYGDHGAGGTSSMAAMAGYPNITVPAGNVYGLPLGMSFFGRAWSEPVLLKIAYAFEQATKARMTPQFIPSIG
jgi:amidase